MGRKKKEISNIHSSAAEYLTFVASTGDSDESVEMRYENENIWLTQKMMATLYDVTIPAINQHIKKIYDDNELTPSSTIKNILIVQNEGKRKVSRNIEHYSLQLIIAVGFKINNERAVQFRKWAGLFNRDKSTISRHIKNVFKEGELVSEVVVAYFATVQKYSQKKRGKK